MTDWSTLKKLIWLRIIKGGGSALRTVTGAIVHVTNALALPAESLSVNVEPIQAGTGDPSPDNVRPISGRTSATVTRTGKNLFDIAERSQNQTNAYGEPSSGYTLTNGVLSISKDVTTWGRVMLSAMQMKSGTYTLSFTVSKSGSGKLRYSVRDMNSKTDIIAAIGTGATSITQTFTVTSDTPVAISIQPEGSATGTVSITNLQIELGSTATAYEPYAGNTYTIQLGDTVYGGALDVTGGKMVVKYAYIRLQSTWTWYTVTISGAQYFTTVQHKSSLVDYKNLVACTHFRNSGNANAIPSGTTDVCICNAYGRYYPLNVRYDAKATVDDFKTFLAENEVYIVLEVNPLEITLTPTQIDMLLGTNNLWADAGDSTLTYYAEGEASTSEALGILLGGTYNNPGGADDVSDDEALGILLGGS